MIRRLILCSLLAGVACAPAYAQTTYPTTVGSRAQGTVPLQCDAAGISCAPVTVANPVPTSAASLPLPAGAATEATLSAASAKLPASLGAKTGATSISVVPNSDTAFPASQSGTWNVTNVSGTVSLPTGAATAAKQPALGTAGAASTDVLSVQGIASGTALPISAASLPLPSGASTAAKQPALGTAGTASADVITIQGVASMTKLLVTPDSVALPANQSVNVSQINGITPLMGNGVTGTGSQRVTIANDNTAFSVNAIQSGTWTVQPGNTANTTPWLVTATGNVASGAADSGNPVKIGGVYNSTLPTFTTGQRGDAQLNSRGVLRSALVADADGGAFSAIGSPADNQSTAVVALTVANINYAYDGATLDLQRGDTAGMVSQPYAMTGSRWGYAAEAGGISNTTTARTMAAAAGASVRNYVTSCQIDSDALGAATELAIRDGAAGTVLWRLKIGTAGLTSGLAAVFPVALKGTANTLIEIVTLTATVTGGVFANCQGYTAP